MRDRRLIFDWRAIFFIVSGLALVYSANFDTGSFVTAIGAILVLLGAYRLYWLLSKRQQEDEEYANTLETIRNSLSERGLYKVYWKGMEKGDKPILGKLRNDVDYYTIELIDKDLIVTLFKVERNYFIDDENKLIFLYDLYKINDREYVNIRKEVSPTSLWLKRYSIREGLLSIGRSKEMVDKVKTEEVFEL